MLRETVYMLSCLALFSSCAKKILFTSAIRNDLEAKNIALNKLKYYVDQPVVLERQIPGRSNLTDGAQLQNINGKLYEAITFSPRSPATCEYSRDSAIAIAYGVRTDSKNLFFGNLKHDGSSIDYVFIGRGGTAGQTEIKYNNYIFKVLTRAGLPKLMINKRQYAKLISQ